MKKKLLSIACAIGLALTTFTGCGSDPNDPFSSMSKQEVIQAYSNLSIQMEQVMSEYEQYKALTIGIQSETEITAAIGVTGDGTGRYTFNSTDSKIVFPVTFQYPGSELVVGNGVVSLADGLTIKPTSNWICKLNGTNLELENIDSGISGTIKLGKQSRVLSAQEIKDQVLSAWFEKLPPAQVSYIPISVGGEQYGMQATTPTTIDSEDAFLVCGMIAESGGYCVTYVFVYRGRSDNSTNESIQNLLNSVELNGKNIIVQVN